MKYFFLILFLGISLSSCAKPLEHVVNIPEPLEEIQTDATKTNSDGSLWPGEQHSLFADNKARTVGDMVTITIAENASASKEATTDSNRNTSLGASVPNLLGLESSAAVQNSNLDVANLVKAGFDNTFKGAGKTVRKENLIASLTTQVIRVYPNGNLKIRGGKEVQVNNETQIIYLTGIIRPVDIMANNTVDSSQILNAKISYTGKGAVSDNQSPGWLTRSLNNVWPF